MKIPLIVVALLISASPAFAQPAPDDLITQGDTNHDGGIDKREWAAMGAPIDFPDQADTNRDGKIDLNELKAMFAQFQVNGGPPPDAPATAAPTTPPQPPPK